MSAVAKNIFLSISIGFLLFSPAIIQAQSQEEIVEPVNVYFFYSDTCPHCAKEEVFLDELEILYWDDIIIHRYEVTKDIYGQELFNKFASASSQLITGVPATFVGSQVIVGFGSEDSTGLEIQQLIDDCIRYSCQDSLEIITSGEIVEDNNLDLQESNIIHIPVIGSVDIGQYSLFGLTVVLAAVDGFNPCAMWVLLILISMLLGMKDRKRMWILGLSFIAASAFVYFIFLAAWFNFFKFIGFVRWVQILVGLFAAGVGVFYLRRFWKTRPGECEVANPEQKRKITDKLRQIVHERGLWLALAGIIGLAFVVNLIELACSAGLPAIFTQVIALNDLTGLQYYGYLLLYIFIFMLDDMIIFAIAMVTLKAVGTTGKYSRYATLIGGVIIFIIGILLMIKPELVMIG